MNMKFENKKNGVLHGLFVPCLCGFFLLFAMYVNLFFIIFDMEKIAHCHDEDNRIVNGRVMPVAIGPRPWLLFCPSAFAHLNYEGDEWPFVAYRPFCEWWLVGKKHVPPIEWGD